MAMARSLEDAAIPLDHVVAALRSGALSLDFLDAAAYERFATLAGETFRQVSDRTGVPLEDRRPSVSSTSPATRG
jgi:hypothetical protein